MKKAFKIFIFLGLILFVSNAYAFPTLQINLPSGWYVEDFDGDPSVDGPFDEGMLIKDSSFTLQAFYQANSDPSISSKTFYLSYAILNDDGSRLNSSDLPLTSIGVNGVTVNSWIYGTPDVLNPHGVFPTYYNTTAFNYAPSDYTSNGIFNVEDGESGKKGYIYNFDIDIFNIPGDRAIVFDLYTYDLDKKIVAAPFSHNASYHTPEPASLSLL